MTIERKSAAIMFTDIAGYTEAMSQNEHFYSSKYRLMFLDHLPTVPCTEDES